MSISTVINFCSSDYPFLRPCIESVRPFSSQILVPICDHFFDGKKEMRETLNAIYSENLDVQFLEFPFDKSKKIYGASYWHNFARLIASYFVVADYVLFIDTDEIADTSGVSKWLNTFPYQDYAMLRLLNYWYFRQSTIRATNWEDTPLLVNKNVLNGQLLMNERERAGMYDCNTNKKIRRVAGLDDKPLFHHYSWVRTKEQMVRKTTSWGHNKDRDWAYLIEEEFSRPFNGTDFVHGYEFEEVEPFVNIDLDQKPKLCSSYFSHVRKLSFQQTNKIDISLTYQIPVCL